MDPAKKDDQVSDEATGPIELAAAEAEGSAPIEAAEAAVNEQPPSETETPEVVAAPSEAAPPETSAEAPAEAPAEAAAEAPAEAPAEAAPPENAKADKAKQARNASLFRSFRTRRPLRCRVEKVIKGGYELKMSGGTRGFCPHSQIDIVRSETPEEHVSQTYAFRITQLRRGGDDVVLSRRAILEEQRKEEAAAVRATVVEGAIRQGRVIGLAPFGAFVDIGAGVTGLVHVSELSHGHITQVDQAVQVGLAVDVKVLGIDDKKGRISLSVRQAQKDPWDGVDERFQVGQVYPGTVRRSSHHGVFVELAPGVEALAPLTELPPSRDGFDQDYAVDQERSWFVLSTDEARRRVSITPQVEGAASVEDVKAAAVLTGRVQRVERFGVFVWLGPGRVGLMPNPWTGVPRGEDMRGRYPIGEQVEVEVVDVSSDGRRIRLTRKGVAPVEPEARQAAPQRPRRARPSGRPQASRSQPTATIVSGDTAFGQSLADKLKAALDRSA